MREEPTSSEQLQRYVVVVDDEEVVGRVTEGIVRHLLSLDQYDELRLFSDPAWAIDFLKGAGPESYSVVLLVTDFQMPPSPYSGAEVIEAAMPETPAMMVSGLALEESVRRAISRLNENRVRAGGKAAVLVAKPCTIDRLRAAISLAFNQEGETE